MGEMSTKLLLRMMYEVPTVSIILANVPPSLIPSIVRPSPLDEFLKRARECEAEARFDSRRVQHLSSAKYGPSMRE